MVYRRGGFRLKHWLLIVLSAVAFYYYKTLFTTDKVHRTGHVVEHEVKSYEGNGVINYRPTNGLCGAALKTAIHKIIRPHVILDFDVACSAKYWWENYFKKTDWRDGAYWDMYSNKRLSTYEGGNVQNREHCMPRSWWGNGKTYDSFDANGDLFNLYPADQEANAEKNNLCLGEVGISRYDNGVVKVGKNTYPNGYRGYVFEPADEYKGDFARDYFYMVTCYEDYADQWHGSGTNTMLNRETYPVFKPWAVDMLLKWSRADPVSQKERDRNEAVYRIQKNRNPFIDFPDLAEYIWGNKKLEPFDSKGSKVFRTFF